MQTSNNSWLLVVIWQIFLGEMQHTCELNPERELMADQSNNSTNEQIIEPVTFVGVIYRRGNDSKIAATPKTWWLAAHKIWEPEAHCRQHTAWGVSFTGSSVGLNLFPVSQPESYTVWLVSAFSSLLGLSETVSQTVLLLIYSWKGKKLSECGQFYGQKLSCVISCLNGASLQWSILPFPRFQDLKHPSFPSL